MSGCTCVASAVDRAAVGRAAGLPAGASFAAAAIVAGGLALPSPAGAAFERAPLTPESEAMGGVLAVAPDGIWGNPAGPVMPDRNRTRVLQTFTARPFGLPELTESQAGAGMTGRSWALGLGAGRFGSQVYVEKELRLAAAWHATPTLALGAAARGLSAGGSFAPVRSFALDLAFRALPDADTGLGAVLEAVVGEVPGDPRAEHRRTALGIARRFGAAAVLRVELQRQGGGPLAAVLGGSWTPWPPLALRAGAREEPRTVSWGFTVRRGAVAVSGSAAHTALGRTLRIGLRASR
jgi:hypothetical protein